MSSGRVGQETFAISASTAIKKSANFGKLTNRNETQIRHRKHDQRNTKLHRSSLVHQQQTQPPTANRRGHRQGGKRQLAGDSPLVSFIKPPLKQPMCSQRSCGASFFRAEAPLPRLSARLFFSSASCSSTSSRSAVAFRCFDITATFCILALKGDFSAGTISTLNRTTFVAPARPQAAFQITTITDPSPYSWQGRRDLNPQPLVLETSALPIELHPWVKIRSSKSE